MAGNYAVELLLKARDRASNAISGVRTKLRRVGTQAERTDSRIRRLGRGVRSVGRGLRGLSGGLLRSVTRGFGRLAARAGALGSLLAGGLGIYALQRTFRNAISSAGDFEQQLARVQAVSGATERQMARLRAEANRLGQETTFTAKQAAQGLEELSRTGFSTEESIASLESTLNLAQSQGMDLGRAAEIASDALKGFGMEAQETGRMADVMAAASQKANTNVERLGTAFSYAGPTARSANMSLEETVATISALQDAGIQGERAGTQLRAILQQIRDPGTKAAEALRQMSVDTSSLTSIIEGLNNAGPEASQAINAFTRESRTAVRVLMDRGGEDLSAFTEELRNSQGTAARTAETMQDTLQGALQRLGSAWDALRRKLVSPLLAPIRREVEALAGAFQRFAESRGMESLRTALVDNFRRGARAVRAFVAQFSANQIGQVLSSWVNGAARAVKAIWNGFQWLGEQIGAFWGWLTKDDRLQRYAQAVVASFRWMAGQVRTALDLIQEALNPNRLGFGEWLRRQGERAYGVLRTIAQYGVQIHDVFRRVGSVFRGVVSFFITGGSRIVQTAQTIRKWILKVLKPTAHLLDMVGKIQSLLTGQEGFGGYVDRINEMVADAQSSANKAKYMAEAANKATREEFGKAFSKGSELGMPEEPPWSDWEPPESGGGGGDGGGTEDRDQESGGQDQLSGRSAEQMFKGVRQGAEEGAKEGTQEGAGEEWEATQPEGQLTPETSAAGSGESGSGDRGGGGERPEFPEPEDFQGAVEDGSRQGTQEGADEATSEPEAEDEPGIQLDGGQATQAVERGVDKGNSRLREETGRLADQYDSQGGGDSERRRLIEALHEATRQGDTEAVRETTRALQALKRDDQQRQGGQAGGAQQRPSRVTRIEIGDRDGGTRAEMDVPEEQADNVLSALEEAGGRVAD